MRLFSWNVNGLRAVMKKGFQDWIHHSNSEIVCLQEIKLQEDQYIWTEELSAYQVELSCAQKKGYSGVATLYKGKDQVRHQNLGIEKFDREGRTIISEFENLILFNCYFPNGQRDHARVSFKLEYCHAIAQKVYELKKKNKPIIVCGDYNTAHREIDLKNPKANKNTTGFLPQERAWMDDFIDQGMIDIFRHYHPQQEGHYTWWTYRNNCRERNIGWRIDYFFIDSSHQGLVKNANLHPEVLGSDHCPLSIDLKL